MWFCLFSVNSLATSITASLLGTNWMTLSGQQKFEIVVAIIGNWTGTIMAFLSKASSKVAKGIDPLTTGNTDFFADPGFDKNKITPAK